jgi:very-short-patch-repair endonuclease
MPEIHNRKELEKFRKELRNNSTSAEATLWKYLKGKQLGKKFRRQHSVGNYILDFYCATDRIAIELDGEKHFTEEGMRYDAIRTNYLNSLNIKVIRFENVRVFEDIESVLNEIRAAFNLPDPADGVGGSVPPETGGKKCKGSGFS